MAKETFDSNWELIKTISSKSPGKTDKHFRKMIEELGEFTQEMNKLDGIKKTEETPEEIHANLTEEASDFLQCFIAVLIDLKVDKDFLMSELTRKTHIWNKKYES